MAECSGPGTSNRSGAVCIPGGFMFQKTLLAKPENVKINIFIYAQNKGLTKKFQFRDADASDFLRLGFAPHGNRAGGHPARRFRFSASRH